MWSTVPRLYPAPSPSRTLADIPGSRLIRLIPTPPPTDQSPEARERRAIYNLMAHRFPAEVSEKIVREQWAEIVEGRGQLWRDIGEDKRECIRGESFADMEAGTVVRRAMCGPVSWLTGDEGRGRLCVREDLGGRVLVVCSTACSVEADGMLASWETS